VLQHSRESNKPQQALRADSASTWEAAMLAIDQQVVRQRLRMSACSNIMSDLSASDIQTNERDHSWQLAVSRVLGRLLQTRANYICMCGWHAISGCCIRTMHACSRTF